MALSELSDRLDYLTSFSSQLVFVCTDKIKQQSQFVESYISQQNEQTDLALLTANELTPLAIYREKLFHQLISQEQSTNYTLPLNQVLADLNQHEGPVLISIFQAEKLPTKLVKEIWELVLQSRFANNKQHLNVLLMGQSEWAEKTNEIIAANSKEKPILINNINHAINLDTNSTTIPEYHSEHVSDHFFVTQVDKLHNATKTKKVAKHSRSKLKKWGLTVLFSLIFIGTFAGMLYWLYPNTFQNLISHSDQAPQKEIMAVSATQGQAQGIERTAPVTNTATSEITSPTDTDSQLPESIIDSTELAKPEIKSSTSKSLQIEGVQVGAESLVTDWQSATTKLSDQAASLAAPVLKETSKQELALKLLPIAESTITELPITEQQPKQEQLQQDDVQNNRAIDAVNDYPVEDIALPVNTNQEVEQVQTAALSTIQATIKSGQIEDRTLQLTKLPNGQFVIQLAAMSNFGLLREYAAAQNLKESLWLYTTQRYGGNWYVLLYHQHFATVEQARTQIAELSEDMLESSPFAKSIRQVQREIAKVTP